MGAMAPQRPDKNENMAQFAAFCITKKIFPGGMPPDPPNSLICSVFLALAAAGLLQCERLEPPVGLVPVFRLASYILCDTCCAHYPEKTVMRCLKQLSNINVRILFRTQLGIYLFVLEKY